VGGVLQVDPDQLLVVATRLRREAEELEAVSAALVRAWRLVAGAAGADDLGGVAARASRDWALGVADLARAVAGLADRTELGAHAYRQVETDVATAVRSGPPGSPGSPGSGGSGS
jgi:hypothetical protein